MLIQKDGLHQPTTGMSLLLNLGARLDPERTFHPMDRPSCAIWLVMCLFSFAVGTPSVEERAVRAFSPDADARAALSHLSANAGTAANATEQVTPSIRRRAH